MSQRIPDDDPCSSRARKLMLDMFICSCLKQDPKATSANKLPEASNSDKLTHMLDLAHRSTTAA